MPKNKVSDLITDQEMAFARLLLSGTMTDRAAAQTAGLNPDTAAYTKTKPRVRAYMVQYRAAAEQQLLEQQAEELRQWNQSREQVLARLWKLANLSPEMTRNSLTGQVKALALIIAIQGFVPDRRAASAEKKPAPPLTPPAFYKAAWLRAQREKATAAESASAFPHEQGDQGEQREQGGQGDQGDLGLAPPEPNAAPAADAPTPSVPGPAASPASQPGQSTTTEATPAWAPGPGFNFVPDSKVPFWMRNLSPIRRR